MVSGDDMEKEIVVKQKHRYTGKREMMYKGKADFIKNEDGFCLVYEEQPHVFVKVSAYEDYLEIERKAEVHSHLCCHAKTVGKAVIASEYGEFELEIKTHRYIRKEHSIAVSYDIIQGNEASDGFTIIWTIEDKGGMWK